MRVISGRFRGRRLTSPADDRIRPTTDRLRETLFNMLTHVLGNFSGVRVGDVYAGTGALGIEALSRGAKHATFVDNHPASVRLIQDNIAALGLGPETSVLRADATRLPAADTAFDLVFLDPPYHRDLVMPTLDTLRAGGWLRAGTIVVVESETGLEIGGPGMTVIRDRSAGAARITILEVTDC